MQSWVGMLQTLKQYARNPSPPVPQDQIPTPNGLSVSPDAVLHQILVERASVGADIGREKEKRSTTLPMTTGLRVKDEVGGASDGAESGVELQRRPRSQA